MYILMFNRYLWVLVWRGGWPQSIMCAADKHRLASLAPGWVTTLDFSDESSPHTYTRVFQPTVTPTSAMVADAQAQ